MEDSNQIIKEENNVKIFRSEKPDLLVVETTGNLKLTPEHLVFNLIPTQSKKLIDTINRRPQQETAFIKIPLNMLTEVCINRQLGNSYLRVKTNEDTWAFIFGLGLSEPLGWRDAIVSQREITKSRVVFCRHCGTRQKKRQHSTFYCEKCGKKLIK